MRSVSAQGADCVHIVQCHSDTPLLQSLARTASECGALVFTEPDSGIYDGISRGLDRACGAGAEVLSWLNADEQYLEGALDRVSSEFAGSPEVSLVYGDYMQLDGGLRPVSVRREIGPNMFLLRNGVNYIMSCSAFFTRGMWRDGPRLDTSYRLVADKKFYFLAMERGFIGRHVRGILGAAAVTGRNASSDFAAASAEQARLREELGSGPVPVRLLARMLRRLIKLCAGCYGRIGFSGRLYNVNGVLSEYDSMPVGSRWSNG